MRPDRFEESPQMKKLVVGVVFAWFVVNFQGQRLTGPFQFVGECNSTAQDMARHRSDVSGVCRWFQD
jgi:hypothetical protein